MKKFVKFDQHGVVEWASTHFVESPDVHEVDMSEIESLEHLYFDGSDVRLAKPTDLTLPKKVAVSGNDVITVKVPKGAVAEVNGTIYNRDVTLNLSEPTLHIVAIKGAEYGFFTIEVIDYVEQRRALYPPVEEFLDAWVKNDTGALENYRRKCLAVKRQVPKGEPDIS